ncbi:MAG: glycosyltransferase, partial [Cellulomonas sp.]|nr:glycosyltransferase [Cellulomonas sp.]
MTTGPDVTIDLDNVIDQDCPSSAVDTDTDALALVRLHAVPIGVVAVPAAERQADGGTAWVCDRLAAQIEAHCQADGIADPSQPAVCSRAPRPVVGPVSVVIPTVGRRESLVGTVAALLASDHRDIEIVVVDNRPGTGRVSALMDQITDPRVRVVESCPVIGGVAPEPGISVAFNAGARAAQAPVVVFTNDDTQV